MSERILYLSYDGLTDPLGEAQVLPYLHTLVSRGAQYGIISFEKKSRAQAVSRLQETLHTMGIEWKPLPYHKHPPVLSTLFDILRGYLAAAALHAKTPFRISHCRGYIAGSIGLLLKKTRGVPFIFDMRGFWADERVEAGMWKKNGVIFRAAKKLEKMLLKEAGEIIALTEAARRELAGSPHLRDAAARISVIPTCVDLARFAPASGTRPRTKRFIYVGSLSTWYLPEEMVAFFRAAEKTGLATELLVVTQEASHFKNMLAEKGLEEKGIRVVTPLTRAMIPELIRSADAGLSFYTPGFSRKGCAPTKIGEYLACGIPVVATAGVGDTDSILLDTRTGVSLPECTGAAFTEALASLKRLLEEPGPLAQRCHQAARKYFSLDEGCNRIRALYQRAGAL